MPLDNDDDHVASGETRGNVLLDLLIDAMVARLKEAREDPEKPLSPSEVVAMSNFCKQNGISISTLDNARRKKLVKVAGELVPGDALDIPDLPGFGRR